MCGQLGRLTSLYEAYKDRAEFLFIYVTEATQPCLDRGPESMLERIRRGLRDFKLPFTCLLDRPDASVELAYSVFATGLIIVDRNGRVAFDAGPGLPGGWDFGAVEAVLRRFPPVP
jgi:hypothetical protein